MKGKASKLLQDMLGEHASFREGQWECIESVINLQKTLVVQRTGWGKIKTNTSLHTCALFNT